MKYTPVTIYKRTGEVWEKTVFRRARVKFVEAISKESGGNIREDEAVARIYSRMAKYIRPGDKLVIGECSENKPDSDKVMTVVEISDNTCISRAHYRITAR